jgi:DNA-directed RNA polymerase specialized sigma24 family protein
MDLHRPDDRRDGEPAAPRRFATTHWSVVQAACDRGEPGSREAMARICADYWYPLYAFVRRKGHDAESAADLTQEFFARLLEKDFLAAVDRGRGRFRSFLLAACTHFLANERDRDRARKRGGGRPMVSIDAPAAEGRYRREPAHGITPERLFERRWALTLLDGVLEGLGREYREAGKGDLYDRLRFVLLGDRGAVPYVEVADALGMTEVAVKKAAERLRLRYRAALRERIAETVEDAGQVEDEIRALFAALGP